MCDLKEHYENALQLMMQKYRSMDSGDLQTIGIFVKILNENKSDIPLKDQCEKAYKLMTEKYRNMNSGDLQTVAIFKKYILNNEIYVNNGFDNRKKYLEDLAETHSIPIDMLLVLADTLGPNEDFDGLVTAAQDMERQLSMEE